MSFKPFADATSSYELDDLTLENNEDRVALYGSLNISRDEAGLAKAKQLQQLCNELVSYLEQVPDLPKHIEIIAAKSVNNPFQS